MNVASVWLLSGGEYHHGHRHGHDEDQGHGGHDEADSVATPDGVVTLSAFQDEAPPMFRPHPQPASAIAGGACVIASWSWGLIRDTGAVLLDMVPDRRVADGVLRVIEVEDGDKLADLRLWRLGPGYLGAIVSTATAQPRDAAFYRQQLIGRFKALSHITIKVREAV